MININSDNSFLGLLENCTSWDISFDDIDVQTKLDTEVEVQKITKTSHAWDKSLFTFDEPPFEDLVLGFIKEVYSYSAKTTLFHESVLNSFSGMFISDDEQHLSLALAPYLQTARFRNASLKSRYNGKQQRLKEREFIYSFVHVLFNSPITDSECPDNLSCDDVVHSVISKEHVAIMFQLLEKKTARRDFAVALTQQRAISLKLRNQKIFEFVCRLFEHALQKAEQKNDFKNAKILMYMAATFYYDPQPPENNASMASSNQNRAHTPLDEEDKESSDEEPSVLVLGNFLVPPTSSSNSRQERQFIQDALVHLLLWRNKHFWEEALIDTIRNERNKVISVDAFRELSLEQQEEFVLQEKNIAFATVLNFVHNMTSLHVPIDDIQTFSYKWCMFYSLPDEMTNEIMNHFMPKKVDTNQHPQIPQYAPENTEQKPKEKLKKEKKLKKSASTKSPKKGHTYLLGKKKDRNQDVELVDMGSRKHATSMGSFTMPEPADIIDPEKKKQWQEDVKKQWLQEQAQREQRRATQTKSNKTRELLEPTLPSQFLRQSSGTLSTGSSHKFKKTKTISFFGQVFSKNPKDSTVDVSSSSDLAEIDDDDQEEDKPTENIQTQFLVSSPYRKSTIRGGVSLPVVTEEDMQQQ